MALLIAEKFLYILLTTAHLFVLSSSFMIEPIHKKGQREVGVDLINIIIMSRPILIIDMTIIFLLCQMEYHNSNTIRETIRESTKYMFLLNNSFKISLLFLTSIYLKNTSYQKIKFIYYEYNYIYIYLCFLYFYSISWCIGVLFYYKPNNS